MYDKNAICREMFDCGYDDLADQRKREIIDRRFDQLTATEKRGESRCERGNAFVSVHKIGNGNTIFVILESREAFDLIDLPMTDHGQNEHGGHVITKAIMDGNQHLVFQYWIENPLELARLESNSVKCLSDRPNCKVDRPHIHEADGKVVYCEFD